MLKYLNTISFYKAWVNVIESFCFHFLVGKLEVFYYALLLNFNPKGR